MDAEVVDDGLVQHLGHNGALSHGESGLDLFAPRHGKKPNGLAVGGDDVDIVGGEAKVFQHAQHGVGKIDTQHEIDLRHLLW